MNQPYKNKATCLRCHGTGLITEVDAEGIEHQIECDSCDGTGLLEWGIIDGANEIAWIKRKIKKILQKLDIPVDDDDDE